MSPGLWIRIVLMRIRIRIQLKILMLIRIRIQIRGAEGSAKYVHPPWQNPRYAPDLIISVPGPNPGLFWDSVPDSEHGSTDPNFVGQNR